MRRSLFFYSATYITVALQQVVELTPAVLVLIATDEVLASSNILGAGDCSTGVGEEKEQERTGEIHCDVVLDLPYKIWLEKL